MATGVPSGMASASDSEETRRDLGGGHDRQGEEPPLPGLDRRRRAARRARGAPRRQGVHRHLHPADAQQGEPRGIGAEERAGQDAAHAHAAQRGPRAQRDHRVVAVRAAGARRAARRFAVAEVGLAAVRPSPREGQHPVALAARPSRAATASRVPEPRSSSVARGRAAPGVAAVRLQQERDGERQQPDARAQRVGRGGQREIEDERQGQHAHRAGEALRQRPQRGGGHRERGRGGQRGRRGNTRAAARPRGCAPRAPLRGERQPGEDAQGQVEDQRAARPAAASGPRPHCRPRLDEQRDAEHAHRHLAWRRGAARPARARPRACGRRSAGRGR